MTKAGKDLDVARDLFELEHWGAAAFHAQQAAEKALKAVQVHREGEFDRTHDLVALARRLKGEDDLRERCARLSRFYVADRYPDAPGGVAQEDVGQAVEDAEEVIAWVRTRMS